LTVTSRCARLAPITEFKFHRRRVAVLDKDRNPSLMERR
jgi:hypothetical protein